MLWRLLFLLALTVWAKPVYVGGAAPDFRLKATDGNEHGLHSLLGKNDAVVVVFVATQCPFSNAYNERYNQLVRELGRKAPKRAAFLAINANDTESFDEVQKHAKEKGFSFAVLKDEKHVVADAFGAEKTPEAFLIGKTHEVLYKGRIDDDSEGKNIKRRDLMAAVDEYLAGKPITVKETKAFGCSIKRK